jgi:uncharacterized repeat protein (TIGR03803 family)
MTNTSSSMKTSATQNPLSRTVVRQHLETVAQLPPAMPVTTRQVSLDAVNWTILRSFALATDGTGFTILHSFGEDQPFRSMGATPLAGSILSGNTLYGTTEDGGDSDAGTVFNLTLPSPQVTLCLPEPSHFDLAHQLRRFRFTAGTLWNRPTIWELPLGQPLAQHPR